MKNIELERLIGQEVTLNGIARDAKGGAVLVIERTAPVYIEGLAFWTPELLGMNVSVKGLLKKEKIIPDPVIGENGGISQGAIGTQFVLLNAVWEKRI
jgi:hypothetical protein